MNVLDMLPLFLIAGGLLSVLVTAALYRGLRRPPRFTFADALARGFPTEPAGLGLEAEERTLRDAAGKDTAAWVIAGRDPKGPLVLMLHGFGRSRYSSLELAPAFVGKARQLVLVDLPAHGDSAAKASHAGVTEWRDVLAYVEQVRADDRPVVLYGRSMGAGISIAAAAHSPGVIAGVIAEGAYRDWAKPIRRRLRLRRYPAEPFVTLIGLLYRLLGGPLRDFDRARLAERLTCPLLLLHGSNDAICPLDDAQAIAAAARHAELVVFEGGQHLDLHRVDEPRHRDAVTRFLSAISSPGRPGGTMDDAEAVRPAPSSPEHVS